MDVDMQNGRVHTAWIGACVMDMNKQHVLEHAIWIWICSMDMDMSMNDMDMDM
jgi:hypothetical protein